MKNIDEIRERMEVIDSGGITSGSLRLSRRTRSGSCATTRTPTRRISGSRSRGWSTSGRRCDSTGSAIKWFMT